jgi:hypothetical protein
MPIQCVRLQLNDLSTLHATERLNGIEIDGRLIEVRLDKRE